MVNLDDIHELFSKEEIALRREEIKQRQKQNTERFFIEKGLRKAGIKKMQDAGWSRITITHNPRERDPRHDPKPEPEPEPITINTTTKNEQDLIDEIIEETEHPEPEPEKTLPSADRIAEARRLLAELSEITGTIKEVKKEE